jgi:cell wall-associated NlpC family hydrolase
LKKATVLMMGIALLFFVNAGMAMAASTLQETAEAALGSPYKWGGTTTDGFDCSGFTMYVFQKLGVDLPHQSKAQAEMGQAVKKDKLQPGDLVFFNTSGQGISHVGIYLGDDQFIHSATNKGVIKSSLSEPYYAERYVTARRVLTE